MFWQRRNPDRLRFDIDNIKIERAEENIDKKPVLLRIKDLGIELPIYEAEIKDNNKWPTTTEGISYLVSSPIPGEIGNSILYGHNWANLLGNLTKAKPGQIVEIIFSDWSRKIFTIANTQVVSPSQTEILKNSDDTKLTLYTCTGFLDSKRFVVTAKLK